jgi:acyl carrier protein
MSETDIRKIVHEELNNIAPEVDLATVDQTADLREAIDIDSMDFLNFVTALHHRTGVDIPEIDYPKLATLSGIVSYLEGKLKPAKTV